ncbi:HesB/IscA family protein [Candidatus Methylacidithermus pantelleriae]|uniref:Iron-sulfur cluster insertion protein IscA n=1 Tax=Candidatus Methylacidithermus pantelleriae TaxID=2744239 RepID=A0A8J2BSE0_9BACT|nr:iron-sulfur cluster assembly accessory protein [Candidatus Methylacidithermus pantelleriae]CAF0703931.1 iron-sulfur cluster insertion protein IscA [Candidatus Methylacidithermus pantelleriae]
MSTFQPIRIHLTDQAAERLKKFLGENALACAVRIGVCRSGCAGYSYKMQVTQEPVSSEEWVVEVKGIRLLIPKEFARWLDGLEIDYGRSGVNESFRFRNPHAKALCGCGESFSFE